jgi:hypothetical protein
MSKLNELMPTRRHPIQNACPNALQERNEALNV